MSLLSVCAPGGVPATGRDAAVETGLNTGTYVFEQMINTVGNEAMGELAQNTRLAYESAAEETAKAAPRGGLLAMLQMLSKPEAQRSLAFLLAFGEKLQRGGAGL